MARVTAELINRQNKITILNLIRQKGSVSRTELARETGMSAPTVTRIVDSLINSEKLVQEMGEGDSSGGRRPNLISFAGNRYFVIGIDLSPRFITGVLTNLESRILTENRMPTFTEDGFERIMERVGELVNSLVSQAGIPTDKLIGVGLGVAGFIDIRRNLLLASPNFNWERVDPGAELQKHITFPVIFDNLTRVMALGELHYGAGARYDNFVCLKLGMGLGSGVIIDRKPFIGSHGYGSEAGHTVIDSESPRICKCGNRGCFEALVAGQFILDELRAKLDDEQVRNLDDSPDPLIRAIEMIKDDPETYRDILSSITESLAVGITNQIHSYDPDAVVLGGVIAELDELILEPVRTKVSNMVVAHFENDCEILKVAYGEKAVAMGAVALVLERILNLAI